MLNSFCRRYLSGISCHEVILLHVCFYKLNNMVTNNSIIFENYYIYKLSINKISYK